MYLSFMFDKKEKPMYKLNIMFNLFYFYDSCLSSSLNFHFIFQSSFQDLY